MPVRETPELRGLEDGSPRRRIEDDEVVADTVHLREVDVHGERITETLNAGRTDPGTGSGP